MSNDFKKRTKYSYTYYGTPIESRLWSIERRHFQWPWITYNPDLKVTILFNVKSNNSKWYNIELYIKWLTNRKSYDLKYSRSDDLLYLMIYRIVLFSMTLNDPSSRFQGHAILWLWLSGSKGLMPIAGYVTEELKNMS